MSNCAFCHSENVIIPEISLCKTCICSIFKQIQTGGKKQKEAIEKIEALAMPKLMEDSPLNQYWGLDELSQVGEKARLERGLSKDCSPVQIDIQNQTGLFVGSSGETYETSLQNCKCFDFQTRNLPCKHMFRLADEIAKKTNLICDPLFESANQDVTKIKSNEKNLPLCGLTLVLSGEFSGYTREQIAEMIENAGGRVAASVTRKTTFLLAEENTGSKCLKAKELGIRTLKIEDLFKMIKSENKS